MISIRIVLSLIFGWFHDAWLVAAGWIDSIRLSLGRRPTKIEAFGIIGILALTATACDSVPEPYVRLAIEQFIWPVLAALGSLVLYRLNTWIKLRTNDVRKQAIALKLEHLVSKAVALTAQTFVQECVNRSGEGLTPDEAKLAAAKTYRTLLAWLGEEGLAEASEVAVDVSEYLKALIEAQVAVNKGRAL